MFDFLNSGKLEKFKVQSWGTIARSGNAEKTFSAYINPDEFTYNYTVLSNNKTTPGKNGTPAQFLGTAPIELTLKFFLDGTKVTGEALDVAAKINEFYEVVGFDGKQHRTRYLRLFWGKLTFLRPNQFGLDCVLKSASLQYKLFKPNGTPLRVIISATFVEALSNKVHEAEHPKQSADLTHVRVVKEGDTLPAMTFAIYGDFKYYLEVARVNQLQDFRNLLPGMKIYFPPFDKNVKQQRNA